MLVDGEPALVVDATAAALRGHGLDVRTPLEEGSPEDPAARSLLLLVPAGAEAVYRAVDTAGRLGLPWAAIVDGRAGSRSAATADALAEAGAAWVLDADAGLPSVLAAMDGLEEVAAGAVGDPPEDPPRATTTSTTPPARRLASLSHQERAVLEAMADGRSVGETADDLGSTIATVRANRRSVRAKLGARSHLAAVALLLRQEAEDAPVRDRAASGPVGSARPGAPVPHLA